jgi:hypothetical protein
MLNEVQEYAMEKFAGDISQVKDFMDGFIKEAAPVSPLSPSGRNPDLEQEKFDFEQRNKGPYGSLRNGFMGEAGKGLGGLLLSLGIGGAGVLYKKINRGNLHVQFLASLEKAIAGNHIIHEAPRDKVMQYANTLFRFAPNVSTDVNVLTAVLTNAIHGDGIDPMTIKTLTDLEGRYAENDSFSPKTYI